MWNEMKLRDQQEIALKYFFFISRSANANAKCNAMLCIFACSALDLVTMWTMNVVLLRDCRCFEALNIQCIRLIFWIHSKLHQQFTDIPFTVLCCAQYRTILICYALILYLIKLQIRRCFALMRKIPFCHVKMNEWMEKSHFHTDKNWFMVYLFHSLSLSLCVCRFIFVWNLFAFAESYFRAYFVYCLSHD